MATKQPPNVVDGRDSGVQGSSSRGPGMMIEFAMGDNPLAVLEENIRRVQDVVEVMSLTDPRRLNVLQLLNFKLCDKYWLTWEIADLQEAVRFGKEVVEATPRSHPYYARLLSNQANLLRDRCDRYGEPEDLDNAIRYQQKAVEGTPGAHADRAMMLSCLGVLLLERHERDNTLEDLEGAIRIHQEAVDVGPVDGPDHAHLLSNLGITLHAKYKRTGSNKDLEQALRTNREAVETTPPDHRMRALRLSNLLTCLGSKYDRTRSQGDLEEAIRIGKEAIEATPRNDPSRPKWLSNLSQLLGSKYEDPNILEDLHALEDPYALVVPHVLEDPRALKELEEAVRYGQEAVDTLPQDHPDRSKWLGNLGYSLYNRFKHTGVRDDFKAAISCYSAAARMENAPPMVRIRTSMFLGCLLAGSERWLEASEAFESALNLFPKVCSRSLLRDDQEAILSQLSGVSTIAAATALQANRPASDSLKLLEAGRCIIAAFTINTRSDVLDLKEKDPILYEKYETLRERLSYHGNGREISMDDMYGSRAAMLEKLLGDLTATETKIRKIPGFERFQLPPEPKDLMELANSGTIVAFNVSKIRSDAMIVTGTRVWEVNLPDLEYATLKAKAGFISTVGTGRNMVVTGNSGGENSQKIQMQKDLLWVWEVAVLPVLNELGEQRLQRVWWVTAGLMGLIPIHAAGNHSDGSLENTLSRVVSSYTPTFKALKYAREKAKNMPAEGRMLVVNVPRTPGHSTLNTKLEVEAIKKVFGDSATVLDYPTKAEVLTQSEGSSFLHFACHGTSIPHNPSKGGLLLVEKGEPVLLSIEDLDGINLQSAEIAYLSACSTAETSVGELVDEAIHLSNSFQLIGFRHVIGTMWRVDDRAAVEVARAFYEKLRVSIIEGGEEIEVANALHGAVVKFRSQPNIREDVTKWCPFIHVGI